MFGLLDRQSDGTSISVIVRMRVGFNNGGSQLFEKVIDSGVIGDRIDIEIGLDIEVAATSLRRECPNGR